MGVAEGEGTEKFLMEKTKHIPSEFNPTVVTALLSTALTTLSAQLNSTQAVSKRLVTALLSPALTIGFAGV